MQPEVKPISLHITDDRLSVLLACYPPGEEPDALADRILSEMPRLGLRLVPSREGLIAQLLEAMVAAMAEGKEAQNVLVVQGTPVIPSRDAIMEWAGDYFNEDFVIDEQTGRVDYRRRQMVTGIEAGDLLGRLTPAYEGKPGRDVYAKEIAVKPPKRIKIKVGPGVRMEEIDGVQSFFATRAGRVRWAMGILAVDDVLYINRDVGLETGDIAHPGAVFVAGNVQAGSRITATGDVEIMGMLEPAEVAVGGSLIVYGGITGREGCRIRAGGSIQARFVQEAAIECGGDVVVTNEILNTTISAGGALRMPMGRVVGGRIAAHRGISVRQTGSEARARTVLWVGHDPKMGPAQAEKEARINDLKKNMLKIQQTINPLMIRQSRLSAEQRESLTLLMLQVYEIESEIKHHTEELEQLIASEQELATAKIMVHERIYPETTFQIRNEKLAVTEEIEGPAMVHFHDGRVAIRRKNPKEGVKA